MPFLCDYDKVRTVALRLAADGKNVSARGVQSIMGGDSTTISNILKEMVKAGEVPPPKMGAARRNGVAACEICGTDGGPYRNGKIVRARVVRFGLHAIVCRICYDYSRSPSRSGLTLAETVASVREARGDVANEPEPKSRREVKPCEICGDPAGHTQRGVARRINVIRSGEMRTACWRCYSLSRYPSRREMIGMTELVESILVVIRNEHVEDEEEFSPPTPIDPEEIKAVKAESLEAMKEKPKPARATYDDDFPSVSDLKKFRREYVGSTEDDEC